MDVVTSEYDGNQTFDFSGRELRKLIDHLRNDGDKELLAMADTMEKVLKSQTYAEDE